MSPNAPEFRFLEGISYQVIHAAMQAAFADYAVDLSYMTERVLERRARKNGVDLALSPGVFAEGRLVGFTLVGVGPWAGGIGAFDAGTGLVQAFRGQGLASRMFEFALPALRTRGVDAFVLDVLQENAPAIRAYEKAGFSIRRELDCWERSYSPDLAPTPLPGGLSLEQVGTEALADFESSAEWPLSWECSFASQRRVGSDMAILIARQGTEPVGLASFYPELGWLMAIQVKANWRRKGIASALLTRVLADHAQPGQRIRADNIQADDAATRALLERHGFSCPVSQYEMSCPVGINPQR